MQNFKVIQKFNPPYEGAPETTKVLGYFNPYEYPLSLHLPELNRTLMLQPKKFIQMDAKVKYDDGRQISIRINVTDPLFENYVGPGKLAKKESKEENVITWLVRPEINPIPTNQVEFGGTNKFKTDASGRVIPATAPATAPAKVPQFGKMNASAVGGYRSVSEAVKAGVMRNVKPTSTDEELSTSSARKMPSKKLTRHPAAPAAPAPEPAAEVKPLATPDLGELNPIGDLDEAPVEEIAPGEVPGLPPMPELGEVKLPTAATAAAPAQPVEAKAAKLPKAVAKAKKLTPVAPMVPPKLPLPPLPPTPAT